jgi:hypothetical protein
MAGFTLVEGITVSAISLVVVIGLVTFFSVYNKAVNEGSANAMLQERADIVYDQIVHDVRSASQVLGAGEAFSASPSITPLASPELLLYNNDGLIYAAYRILNGVMQEAHPESPVAALGAGAYNDFRITGSEQVTVSPSSKFSLAGARRSVTIDVQLTMNYHQTLYTTASKLEVVRCRNGGS